MQLKDGEFGKWSRLDDEVNDDNHLVIRRPKAGNWVTLQSYPSYRSIHLLYLTHEGAPSLPNTTSQNLEQLDL